MRIDLRWPLLATGMVGALASVRVAAWPLARMRPSDAPLAAARSSAADARRTLPADSVAIIVASDAFRFARRPALPAYDPVRLAEQLAPAPPKPTLLVVGVTSGADPAAVVEGLPGVDGSRVVRTGDVVAGLTIKRISNGQVVIVGMDTTWVLQLREPWKN